MAERLIFVGGMHRSGTTPLSRALASHAQVAGLVGTGVPEDEGQHLQRVYPRIRQHGGMGRFALREASHLTEESELATPAAARRLLEAWTPYWALDRDFLLEKSPANMIMGRFLQALFPGSAQVVVVRHPVVTALALQKWNPTIVARNGRRRVNFDTLLRNWFRAHEILRADSSHMRRLFVLRYEDLISRPGEVTAPLTSFLGLDSPIPVDSIRTGHNSAYASAWRGFADGSILRRRAYRGAVVRYSHAAASWGYSMENVADVRPWTWGREE